MTQFIGVQDRVSGVARKAIPKRLAWWGWPALLMLPFAAQAATFTPATVAQLTAAVTVSNANGSDDVIDLGGRTFTLTAPFAGETSLPTVVADGGRSLTIRNGVLERSSENGTPDFRILEVLDGVLLTLDRITVRGGYLSANNSSGAGIFNRGGTVTLISSTVSSNKTLRGHGGGIHNRDNGTLNLTRSTVSGNETGVGTSGGGIRQDRGTTTVVSSTISGNVGATGGGISVTGNAGTAAVTLTDCTVTGNTATSGGGGLDAGVGGQITIRNSIVSGNSSPNQATSKEIRNSSSTVTSNGYNIIGVDGVAAAAGATLAGTDLVPAAGVLIANILSPLASNGGSTSTHALVPGSPAIDRSGNNVCASTDQRGIPRPNAGTCDVGAVELSGIYRVNSTDDTNDGVCDAANCTLHEAIVAANATTITDVILLPDSATITLLKNTGDQGESGLPSITRSVIVEGRGTIIRRDPNSQDRFRLLTVPDGNARLTLNDLILTGGSAPDGAGGGAIYSDGPLTINRSILSDHRAGNGASGPGADGGAGGAIRSSGALTITDSELSNNVAGNAAFGGAGGPGGAIWANAGLSITGSRLTGNRSGGGSIVPGGAGGAIWGNGNIVITRSVIAGNETGPGGSIANGGFGGGVFSNGPLSVSGSILSGNRAGNGGGTSGGGGAGGGIASSGTLTTITGSTLSGNRAGSGVGRVGGSGGSGGAIFSTGPLMLSQSTVSGNRSGDSSGLGTTPPPGNGGGVQVEGNAATFSRNLITGNSGTSGREVFVNTSNGATVTASADNLFGFGNDAGLSGFSAGATDIVPGAGVTAARILAPLADNGDTLQTHRLVAGSPAIDRIVAGCDGSDQRGVGRPQNGLGAGAPDEIDNSCDIGAYEADDSYDLGDAPDSLAAPQYPTRLANNGAAHAILPGAPYLGATPPDAETGINPDSDATADDNQGIPDEDGISGTPAFTAGASGNLAVAINGSGRLNAWIDWNRDGDWNDAGEQIASDQTVTSGTTTLNFVVPADAVSGTSYLRLRLCSAAIACNTPGGDAADGEVEDHRVTLIVLAPAVSLSPAALDFGVQATGRLAATRSIIVSNTGNGTLSFTGAPTLIGSHSDDFVLVNNGCTADILAGGPSCTITLGFTPGANGARSATLRIPTNAVGSPQTVALDGTGAALNLGEVNTGSSDVRTYVVSIDTGVLIGSFDGYFATSPGFSAAPSCGTTGGTAYSCSVTVTYSPTQGGRDSGTLSYLNGNGSNPQSVALNGLGVGPIPVACNADPAQRPIELIRAVDRANSDTARAQTIHLATGCVYTYTQTNQIGDVDGSRFDREGANALPVILGNLTIEGHGATVERSTTTGDRFRLIYSDSNTMLLLNQLTLSNGRTADGINGVGSSGHDGGAIRALGMLTINDSTLSGNATGNGGESSGIGGDGGDGGDGGAILASGTLTINNSTLSGNTTGDGADAADNGGRGGDGGSIRALGMLTINDSTLSGNTTGNGKSGSASGGKGGDGGAISADVALTALTNSTLSGNRTGVGGRSSKTGGSGGGGGAIQAGSVLSVANSTLSGNVTGAGGRGGGAADNDGGAGGSGGAIQTSGVLTLINSTLSGNALGAGGFNQNIVVNASASGSAISTGSAVPVLTNSILSGGASVCAGFVVPASGSRNLATDDSCGTTGLLVGDVSVVDSALKLDPDGLKNNGGPTQTLALLAGSVALDAGDAAVCSNALVANLDQRGSPRPQPVGSQCDVGAFEAVQFALDVTVTGSGSGKVISDAGGIDCGDSGTACDRNFFPGTVVTLTATPVAGSVFTAWSGACTGSSTCVVTMDQARSVTAEFTRQYTLTLLTNGGTGSGRITGNVGGIDCTVGPTGCVATFNAGDDVILSFAPDAVSSTFPVFPVQCQDLPAQCRVTMDSDKTVTAAFVLAERALTLSATNGSFRCNGIACAATYPHGTSLTLIAVADASYGFTAFSGDCMGTTCVLKMDADRSVTAAFSLQQRMLTVSRTGTGPGTVTGTGIGCGVDCSESIDVGTVVTLVASPAANADFSGFSPNCAPVSGQPLQCTVTMDADKTVTAAFTLKQRTLSLSASNGSIRCNGGACATTYADGTTLTLAAVPGSNYAFTGFGGDCSGTTCFLTMNGNRSVTANFTRQEHALIVVRTGNGSVTGSGISCGADCTEIVPSGSTILLTAAPAANSNFGGFSGNCAVLAGQPLRCEVTLDAAQTVSVTFTPKPRDLTVNRTGTGTGSVTGSGIDCGTDCVERLIDGTVVTLIAAPAANSSFGGFSSNCAPVAGQPLRCVVSLDDSKTVQATFTLLPPPTPTQRTLSIDTAGSGSGVVTGTGINCGIDCSENVDTGTVVTLVAAPSVNSDFDGFSANCAPVAGQPLQCTVTLDAARTVTATFTLQARELTVIRDGTGTGTVTGTGIDCGTDCTASVDAGTVVTLTAAAEANSDFGGFSTNCTPVAGEPLQCTVTLDAATTVTATFTLKQQGGGGGGGGGGGATGLDLLLAMLGLSLLRHRLRRQMSARATNVGVS
jgi:CSLREA domain-containing protein